MQTVTPGKCTSALMHCANRYYKGEKNPTTSTDKLRGTILGNTWLLGFFFQCNFILKNWWLFWENFKLFDLITCNKHIIFSKPDLIKWKIPLKLLKLHEIPNACLCYWHTNRKTILGKTQKTPLKPEANDPVWSFLIGFYSNIVPLTSMEKNNLICI